MLRIEAEDMATDILRTELNGLKAQRKELGEPGNWNGAIMRLVIDRKISALTRELDL